MDSDILHYLVIIAVFFDIHENLEQVDRRYCDHRRGDFLHEAVRIEFPVKVSRLGLARISHQRAG